MPAIANIVIADAVPANHTLYPQQAGIALSTWQATSAATYEGNVRLAMVMSPPSKGRRTTRVRESFIVPFERTVDGIVTVPDTMSFHTDAIIPVALSPAEALHAFTMWKNLQAQAVIQAYLASREPAW